MFSSLVLLSCWSSLGTLQWLAFRCPHHSFTIACLLALPWCSHHWQLSLFRQLYLHLHQLLGVVAMCLDSRFLHVLVQFLVFRMFPRDDPSSERRGNKCPYGWVGGFIPHPFNTDPSTSKSSTGKRFHSLCCGLHNVCTGKPSRSHNCWLERTEVFLHFGFSVFFFTFHSGLPCSAQASCTFNISPSCFIQSKENQNQKQK